MPLYTGLRRSRRVLKQAPLGVSSSQWSNALNIFEDFDTSFECLVYLVKDLPSSMVITSLFFSTQASLIQPSRRNHKVLHTTLLEREQLRMSGEQLTWTHTWTQLIYWQSLSHLGRNDRLLFGWYSIIYIAPKWTKQLAEPLLPQWNRHVRRTTDDWVYNFPNDTDSMWAHDPIPATSTHAWLEGSVWCACGAQTSKSWDIAKLCSSLTYWRRVDVTCYNLFSVHVDNDQVVSHTYAQAVYYDPVLLCNERNLCPWVAATLFVLCSSYCAPPLSTTYNFALGCTLCTHVSKIGLADLRIVNMCIGHLIEWCPETDAMLGHLIVWLLGHLNVWHSATDAMLGHLII